MEAVTWLLVAVALAVVGAAAAISSGRLSVTFEGPYPEQEPPMQAPSAGSGIEWSSPAAERSVHEGVAFAEHNTTEVPARAGTDNLSSTGEPAHGRHEAQDR